MANIRAPRHGSMQFWPRVRANRAYARLRTHNTIKESAISGFAGYKVGMSQVKYIDGRKTSPTKGEVLSIPVTLIECPPLKIFSIRFYQKTNTGKTLALEVLSPNLDKDVGRKVELPKNIKTKLPDSANNFSEIRFNVYTQPKLTGLEKKKPEIFELGIYGSVSEQFEYAKKILGKELFVKDVFKPGQLIDVHAITKGKGTQGPVKRFGLRLRQHKAEKTKRGPASLGPWCGQQHITYRVAHAGKMGFHQRMDFNKWLISIKDSVSSSFDHYGIPKNNVLLIKGSIPGSQKRLITMTHASRPNKKLIVPAPELK